MKQKKMLSLTLSQIRQLYCQELPELTAMVNKVLTTPTLKTTCKSSSLLTYPEGTKRVSKFDSLSATTERLFMSCLTNRICKYRPYLFSDAS